MEIWGCDMYIIFHSVVSFAWAFVFFLVCVCVCVCGGGGGGAYIVMLLPRIGILCLRHEKHARNFLYVIAVYYRISQTTHISALSDKTCNIGSQRKWWLEWNSWGMVFPAEIIHMNLWYIQVTTFPTFQWVQSLIRVVTPVEVQWTVLIFVHGWFITSHILPDVIAHPFA